MLFGFYARTVNITTTIFTTKAQRRQTQMDLTIRKGPPGGQVRECEHARVAGRSGFMEELLAELERRGVPFRAGEIGKK